MELITGVTVIKINYTEKGKGFPLVLIHGLSDDLNFWKPLIPQLSKNFRIIALDLRGHGKSEKPDCNYSIKQFSEDIHEFLLKLNLKKAHFVGFSMGGAISLQFTIDYPEMVRSIILMSSFGYTDPYLKEKFLLLRKSLHVGGFGDFFDEILPLVLTHEFIEKNRIEIAEIKKMKIKTESNDSLISSVDACIEFNLKDLINTIRKPVLIISGREDILIPIHLVKQLYEELKCSNWVIIEDAGHNILIPEKIPQILVLIDSFLND